MKPKKKGYAKQSATFLKIEDAVFWEQHVKETLMQWTLTDYCPLISHRPPIPCILTESNK